MAHNSLAGVWSSIQTQLENEKRRVQQEISAYPSPITACDQQFNYLLEQRSRLSQELTRLHEAFEEAQERGESVKSLEQFVRSSGCLDDEAKQKLDGYLRDMGATPRHARP